MHRFLARRRCPKCGSRRVRTRYYERSDVLRRLCHRCEYGWHELPLDRRRGRV